MRDIPDASIDAIITDPPYQLLKNHKLDIPFDESRFFAEAKRILKNGGFIALFGRGTAFYRWNVRLADLGFLFKEEIIWNKNQTTSPVSSLLRVHETVSIHSKGKAQINKAYVPYLESKHYNMDAIASDIRHMKLILNHADALKDVQQFIDTGKMNYKRTYQSHNDNICFKVGLARCDASVNIYKAMQQGCVERSIIQLPRVTGSKQVHPTQKPVRLMERLIAVVTREGARVLDPFMGSGSTGIACINTGRAFIGIEKDADYYRTAKERIDKAHADKRQELFQALS